MARGLRLRSVLVPDVEGASALFLVTIPCVFPLGSTLINWQFAWFVMFRRAIIYFINGLSIDKSHSALMNRTPSMHLCWEKRYRSRRVAISLSAFLMCHMLISRTVLFILPFFKHLLKIVKVLVGGSFFKCFPVRTLFLPEWRIYLPFMTQIRIHSGSFILEIRWARSAAFWSIVA